MADAPNNKSKILVIGATGYIGKFIALAGPQLGHPTFALVRPSTLTSKPDLIRSFQSSGITILQGSLDDYDSLVSALRQVDVVISAVSGPQVPHQARIIEAIKEVGTIKRFIPSEFGNDVARANPLEPVKILFQPKLEIRNAIKEADIPHTIVVSNGFAGYFLPNLFQEGITSPPKDKVTIYGTGDIKVINVLEDDIGTYTIKAVDDPRTLNKVLHIRPPHNILTLNEIVAIWEKKIGKTLEKITVTEEEFVKKVEETPFPANIFPGILHDIVILGDHTNFELGDNDVEATSLYPDVKYTSADEYFDRFV